MHLAFNVSETSPSHPVHLHATAAAPACGREGSIDSQNRNATLYSGHLAMLSLPKLKLSPSDRLELLLPYFGNTLTYLEGNVSGRGQNLG